MPQPDKETSHTNALHPAITFHKLTNKDLDRLTQLAKLYQDIFEVKDRQLPEASQLQTLLQKEGVIFITACAGAEVIGGLTAYVLPSVYFASDDGYLYDIAVETAHQRKGIGRALLKELKNFCREGGYKEFFVQADLEDQHALDFYRATGGQRKDVVHFSYILANEDTAV